MTEKRINKKYFLISLIFLVLATLVYGLVSFLNKPLKLPPKFLEARQEAARLSQEIVDLTSQTHQLIKEVNVSELNGQTNKALKLINTARESNKNAYNKAFELSLAVQKIVESLNEIDSSKGRELAYEAASLELALISNFISYTQELDKFLNSLAIAIRTNKSEDRRQVIQNLAEVNKKIFTINNLNKNFLKRMEELDSL